MNKIHCRSQTTKNADSFKVFDSFSEFVKPMSNQTKLPENLPFGFSVVQTTELHNY